MALIKPMISNKSNEWGTPQTLVAFLRSEFAFTLDPCSTHQNHKADRYYTADDDGLSKSWENEVVFMNPPYGGHTKDWLLKAKNEAHLCGATVVCLIVSSTDRSYWHDCIYPFAQEIRFFRGRVKFGGSKSTAPFASAVVVFNPTKAPCKVSFVDYRQVCQ